MKFFKKRKRLKKKETPQLNEILINTETPQNNEETPQLNEVYKNTETRIKILRKRLKKRGNISTK